MQTSPRQAKTIKEIRRLAPRPFGVFFMPQSPVAGRVEGLFYINRAILGIMMFALFMSVGLRCQAAEKKKTKVKYKSTEWYDYEHYKKIHKSLKRMYENGIRKVYWETEIKSHPAPKKMTSEKIGDQKEEHYLFAGAYWLAEGSKKEILNRAWMHTYGETFPFEYTSKWLKSEEVYAGGRDLARKGKTRLRIYAIIEETNDKGYWISGQWMLRFLKYGTRSTVLDLSK